MADKIQTGISITEEAHSIVKEYATERGVSFSAALEFVIIDWHTKQTAWSQHLANLQETLAKDPNVELLKAVDDGNGGLALQRVGPEQEEA